MRTKFEELTREQLLELTEEDIDFYKKYALAENGIVLPPDPGEEPIVPDFPEPTIPVFSCRGIITTSEEEAKQIVLLSNVVYEEQDYNLGDQYKWLSKKPRYGNEDTGIKSYFLYDKKELDSFKEELKLAKKEVQRHKEEVRDYEKAVKETSELTAIIKKTIQCVSHEKYYIDRAKDKYKELLELSENSKEIAYNFFRKAYPKEETANKLVEYMDGCDLTSITYMEFLDKVGVTHTFEINNV